MSSMEWITSRTHVSHSGSFYSPQFFKILSFNGKNPSLKHSSTNTLFRFKAIQAAGTQKALYSCLSLNCSALKIKVLRKLTSSLRTSIKTSTFQVWACAPSLLSFPSLQIPLPGAEIDCKLNIPNQALARNRELSKPTSHRTSHYKWKERFRPVMTPLACC